MPRIASKRPGSTISHTQRCALITCWGWAHRIYWMCTHNHVQHHTHWYTHTHTKGRIFLLSFFDQTSYPFLMKDSLSAIPSSSSFSVSLAHSRSQNHTSLMSVRTFLLFPRQQWQRILHRRTQPMALAVVWVVVLLGSVELAACVCACFRLCLYVGGPVWRGGACTYALMRLCQHAFMQKNIEMSAIWFGCGSEEFPWERWCVRQEGERGAWDFFFFSWFCTVISNSFKLKRQSAN